MNEYDFYGIVHPERAQITIQTRFQIASPTQENDTIFISIINNQVYIKFSSQNIHEDIDTLKNNIRAVVQDMLNMVGYIKGFGYELEIVRIISLAKNIDYVYGVNIPVLEKRGVEKDLNKEIEKLLIYITKCKESGVFIRMCLRDLNYAMRIPEDTGFHCFRAIEALRNHCAVKYAIEKESDQWKKLTGITGYGKEKMEFIRGFALPNRHGELRPITNDERAKIFIDTWDIVESFLEKEM